MIVYGWNSFQLKECKPSQLGLPAELDATFKIERRQKYFHLFWIPFFGIGKIWVLRKPGDSNMYEPNAELQAFLEALPLKEKTPWYTFALPLLGIAIGVVAYIGSLIGDYTSQQNAERYRITRNIGFKKAINDFTEGSYFKMRDANYKYAYLKPVANEGPFLLCLYSEKGQGYGENAALEAFVSDSTTQSFDTLKLNKQDLMKTINVNDAYPFEGFALKSGERKFVMEELKVVQFPVFKKLAVQYDQGKFLAILQNIGASGKIKEFKPDSRTVGFEWTNHATATEVKSGGLYFLEGTYAAAEPRLTGKVSLVSERDSSAVFDLYINGTSLTFTQNRYE